MLEKLVTQIRSCNICMEHLPNQPRPILQCDAAARILVAGQAPGWRVHESGIPFNDASGQRLRDWMGIDRNQFYDPKKLAIIPMGFCYPGTGKSGDLPPRIECANMWRQSLLAQLPNIELTLVIGQYAQNWHLKGQQKYNLTQTVKAWRDYWPSTLPLPHPSPRNNIWLKRNPWFEEDILPILKEKIRILLASQPI